METIKERKYTMPFSSKMLRTLEFEKITAMLAEHASVAGAKGKAIALLPSEDFSTVLSRQRRTEDAKRLINHKGYPSFSADESVVSSAERAYKGAVLSPKELLSIASLLSSTRALLDYIHTRKSYLRKPLE